MPKYIWPAEGQSFAQALAEAKASMKKRGRPLGSKNKPKVIGAAVEEQKTFDIFLEMDPPEPVKRKRMGRPVGSKNKPGHKAGKRDLFLHSPTYKRMHNEHGHQLAS